MSPPVKTLPTHQSADRWLTDDAFASCSGLPPRISRRDVLRAAVAGGAAMALAACTLDRAPPPVTTPTGRETAVPTQPSASPAPVATPTATLGPTLRQKIAGLVVAGFRGMSLDEAPWLRTALGEGGLGGVVLFDRDQLTGDDRNVRSPEQVSTLVRELRAAAGDRPIFAAIDQEGGVVTRLSPAHGFPPVSSEAEVGEGSADDARAWAAALAATLASVGIDLNLAPVVDLNVDPDSPAIGRLDRSFSADPVVVVELATIEIESHRAAGVRTTLKHFPGIGSSTANTDFGVADVTATWTRTELEPFRRLIDAGLADLVMVGHVINGRLDRDRPASLSKPTVRDLLRGELGWDGVVVTDDLQAAAIEAAFGGDEAILLALEAGSDLLLFANQQIYDPAIVDRVIDVVAGAIEVGRLSETRIDESWARVRRLLLGDRSLP